MSTYSFRPAKRENVSLLIGVAGPSGSGKTLSSLLLAKGLSGGKPFALIDTENGRALHYADDFDFLHGSLEAPFSPERYGEAIKAAAALNPPVIVVDSFSHEHAGDGGVLDLHEAELHRMAGDDWKKREAMKFAAWVKPKAMHKRLISQILQLPCHLIVALRAEDKIDLVKDENGKLKVVPKRTLAGHVGWIPVCGKDLPFELTLSLVVTPDAPGVPKPIKLQDQHRALVPLDKPLSEETGAALAAWAAGSSQGSGLVATMVEDAADSPPVAAAAGPGGLVPQPAGPDQRSGLEPSTVEALTPPVADEGGPSRPSSPDQRSGSVTGTVEGARTPPPVPAGDARGGSPQPSDPDALAAELLELADARGKKRAVQQAIAKNRAAHADDPAGHAVWLEAQLVRARAIAADPDADIPQFQIPESART